MIANFIVHEGFELRASSMQQKLHKSLRLMTSETHNSFTPGVL